MKGIRKYIAKSISLKHSIILISIFTLFYFIINLRFINLLVEENITKTPFLYSYFKFNIFNMDPSQFLIKADNFMHPFFSFIQLGMIPLKLNKYGLYGILFIQSIINSLNVFLIYIYCDNLSLKKYNSLILAIFFGAFSYSINSALVPDSYVYAQSFLIISLVYMQYCKRKQSYGVVGHAILGVLNFSVTVSNTASYALGVLINKVEKDNKSWICKIIKSIILALLIIIGLSVLQYIVFGKTFISEIFESINRGGVSYAAPFSWEKHWRIVYLMFTSPIITAPLKVMITLQAVVTDVYADMPMYINLITGILILLIIFSILTNLKNREMWVLSSVLIVAFYIHIMKGFGLAVFEYDMYLYAGHYIFVVPMYLAFLIKKFENIKLGKIITVLILIVGIVTLISNIFMQNEMLTLIKGTYL